ncbi:MAG: GNAT family N-acetyltransferase [Candidatus Acidiferrales bacterium]
MQTHPQQSRAMSIVELRQLSVHQLEPLLQEESRFWREELRWDYRNSIDLIRRFVDARSLAGSAILENGQAAGYAFYVIEDCKGLIGGLFVSPRYDQLKLAAELLADVPATLRALPHISRIEVQLMPFGNPLDSVLAGQDFRLFPRNFMMLDFPPDDSLLSYDAPARPPAASAFLLERWDHRFFDAASRLIQLAYANHVDGEINDQYRTQSGALKFLKNIVVLPGCGQFLPEASFVLRPPHTPELTGLVLTSTVSPGVAHTTQICVMPGYQGHGLGRLLLDASIQALRARSYSALSLTVTAANSRACLLYEHMGFRTIKSFSAGVWNAR